jgi:hypothetical protein
MSLARTGEAKIIQTAVMTRSILVSIPVSFVVDGQDVFFMPVQTNLMSEDHTLDLSLQICCLNPRYGAVQPASC